MSILYKMHHPDGNFNVQAWRWLRFMLFADFPSLHRPVSGPEARRRDDGIAIRRIQEPLVAGDKAGCLMLRHRRNQGLQDRPGTGTVNFNPRLAGAGAARATTRRVDLQVHRTGFDEPPWLACLWKVDLKVHPTGLDAPSTEGSRLAPLLRSARARAWCILMHRGKGTTC